MSAPASPLRVYLAGPMSGIPRQNYPAFHAAAKRLRDRGFEVVNPAEVYPDAETMPANNALWRECLRRDIPELVACDAVAVLRGWEKSRGARLEVFIAATMGMPMRDAETWSPLAGAKIATIHELIAPPMTPQQRV